MLSLMLVEECTLVEVTQVNNVFALNACFKTDHFGTVKHDPLLFLNVVLYTVYTCVTLINLRGLKSIGF